MNVMQGAPMEEVDGFGIEIEREGCQNPPAEYSDTDSDSWECCGICADLFHIGKFFVLDGDEKVVPKVNFPRSLI